jgi:hypothetical protein
MVQRRRTKLPRLNRENSVVGIAAGAAVCVMGAVSQRPVERAVVSAAPDSSANIAADQAAPIDPALAAEDLKLRKLLVGRWKAAYHGVLIVENRDDGTASMQMQFDFLASFFYGKTLDLKLTWYVENRILTYLIQSGSPEESWKPFRNDFGDKVTYNFREVGENKVQLTRVIAPDERVDWFRTDGQNVKKN